jgi:tripartite-type tricarboxylate transporter receptor subunit TctC
MRLDKGRIEDINLLKRAWNIAGTQEERDLLDEAAYKILNEPQWIRSARESLIKEKRRGNSENMKDIRSEMKKWESKRRGF